MSINRREFLTYSAAASVAATPVVAAQASTHIGLQPVPDGDLPGQPIPDKLLNLTVRDVALPLGAQLFKHEWWLAAYFDLQPYVGRSDSRSHRQLTYATRHGHLPDHRLPDLMAGCVAVYQEQYYQRHGLLPTWLPYDRSRRLGRVSSVVSTLPRLLPLRSQQRRLSHLTAIGRDRGRTPPTQVRPG
jgi:hypothetical protein